MIVDELYSDEFIQIYKEWKKEVKYMIEGGIYEQRGKYQQLKVPTIVYLKDDYAVIIKIMTLIITIINQSKIYNQKQIHKNILKVMCDLVKLVYMLVKNNKDECIRYDFQLCVSVFNLRNVLNGGTKIEIPKLHKDYIRAMKTAYMFVRPDDIPCLTEHDKIVSNFTGDKLLNMMNYNLTLNIIIQLYPKYPDVSLHHIVYRYICAKEDIKYHFIRGLNHLIIAINRYMPYYNMFVFLDDDTLQQIANYLHIKHPFEYPTTSKLKKFCKILYTR
ncbi:Uncharacterised protein [uncultured archaeon]|nr:Uncharacterised protein [uncultured archaeon]